MSHLEKDMSYKAIIRDLDESFRSRVAINEATRSVQVDGKRYNAIDLGAKGVLPAGEYASRISSSLVRRNKK